jgi:hypothetical protein
MERFPETLAAICLIGTAGCDRDQSSTRTPQVATLSTYIKGPDLPCLKIESDGDKVTRTLYEQSHAGHVVRYHTDETPPVIGVLSWKNGLPQSVQEEHTNPATNLRRQTSKVYVHDKHGRLVQVQVAMDLFDLSSGASKDLKQEYTLSFAYQDSKSRYPVGVELQMASKTMETVTFEYAHPRPPPAPLAIGTDYHFPVTATYSSAMPDGQPFSQHKYDDAGRLTESAFQSIDDRYPSSKAQFLYGVDCPK